MLCTPPFLLGAPGQWSHAGSCRHRVGTSGGPAHCTQSRHPPYEWWTMSSTPCTNQSQHMLEYKHMYIHHMSNNMHMYIQNIHTYIHITHTHTYVISPSKCWNTNIYNARMHIHTTHVTLHGTHLGLYHTPHPRVPSSAWLWEPRL